jgi:hypothetical protein
VKVTWLKLFPEEAELDETDLEEEVFPTNVAFPAESRPNTAGSWGFGITYVKFFDSLT